jgi:hypothetical protein
VRLPQTVTIGSRDLPPGARGLEGMTFQVRYSIPLTLRLRLGFAFVRAGLWLIGGTADIASDDGT